jgi:hypothetical protein
VPEKPNGVLHLKGARAQELPFRFFRAQSNTFCQYFCFAQMNGSDFAI